MVNYGSITADSQRLTKLPLSAMPWEGRRRFALRERDIKMGLIGARELAGTRDSAILETIVSLAEPMELDAILLM